MSLSLICISNSKFAQLFLVSYFRVVYAFSRHLGLIFNAFSNFGTDIECLNIHLLKSLVVIDVIHSRRAMMTEFCQLMTCMSIII